MTPNLPQRLAMTLLGGLAGLAFYWLGVVVEDGWLAERLVLALAVFAGTFFGGALALAGRVALPRAAAMATGLAVLVAGLVSFAALRFDPVTEISNAPLILIAGVVLSLVPLPFLIGAAGPGWRDYPTLFTESWGLFVRLSFAWIFVGVVWALILLSGALFDLVGLPLIEDLLAIEVAPWLITGVVFGLALAVVNELSDFVSPFLILRLLRLLLPLVLVVLVVFLMALPFRGLTGLFGGMSSAATLLAMVATAVTLISAAVDQTDDEAVPPGLMAGATRALALILPLPAGLAVWALALRVAQYGWTPERVFGAAMAALAMAYALNYAVSALRAPWRRAIRFVNRANAIAVIALAALWLTPVLNAERIATNSQMARFAASGDPAVLDLWALAQWGTSGAAARAELVVLAASPGQQALADVLAGNQVASVADTAHLGDALKAVMPLQPATSLAQRDAIFAAADNYTLQGWLDACTVAMPEGGPGCVMVVADFLPSQPGDEALVAHYNSAGYVTYAGLSLNGNLLQMARILPGIGDLPEGVDGQAAIRALQSVPPVLVPVPLNMLMIGETGLMLVP
jgi:hypothetical protein